MHRPGIPHVILDSIVVSIPACHAGDRGSIPRRGGMHVLTIMLWDFYASQHMKLSTIVMLVEKEKSCDLARIRTWNLLIRSQTRYPLRHKTMGFQSTKSASPLNTAYIIL